MQLSQLRELYNNCRNNKNYQFKDCTDDQIFEMAQKSFNRLPEQQKLKVQKSWSDTLTANKEELNTDTAAELIKFRFLAQTNLYFLCKLLETYNQVTDNTHEEICNKFFVQKNPTYPTFEKFANQYTDLKDRMLLVPRGGFKSSIDIADCVQWIICFPDITILILTGVFKLAGDFVGELKEHFRLEESGVIDPKTNKSGFQAKKLIDKDTAEWSDSMFQVLFPEHCVPPTEGSQFEFQTPAGGIDKEPTVRAASIEQALAGMHFCVMKLDDVVTNENSQTPDRLAKINKQIGINRAMLHPYGFMDVIGTWYDENDYYGFRIKQEEKFAKEEGIPVNVTGSVDSGKLDFGVKIKIYLRSCWWLTKKAIAEGKTDDDAKKEDLELWFPERLSYEFLKSEQTTDPDMFPIKYLNNPRKIGKIKFPRELLMKRTIPHTQMPPQGQGLIVTTVDTAYSTKSWADYTVILTAVIYGGRFYIVNMVRGRFSEYELPAVIASVGHKWKPKRIVIEDSVGVRWMGRELRREMDKLQISIPVEFVPLGKGSKANSKLVKSKPVVRLLGDERMFFFNSCEGLQEIYNELEQFTGTKDDDHDDIVSALSLLAEQFQAYADMGAKIAFTNQQFVSDRQSTERHNLIYGLGKYSKFNASNTYTDDNPVTAFQVENSRKFRAEEPYIDPLADVMG